MMWYCECMYCKVLKFLYIVLTNVKSKFKQKCVLMVPYYKMHLKPNIYYVFFSL